MTNIITQKHSFDNDEKYEHKKTRVFQKENTHFWWAGVVFVLQTPVCVFDLLEMNG